MDRLRGFGALVSNASMVFWAAHRQTKDQWNYSS